MPKISRVFSYVFFYSYYIHKQVFSRSQYCEYGFHFLLFYSQASRSNVKGNMQLIIYDQIGVMHTVFETFKLSFNCLSIFEQPIGIFDCEPKLLSIIKVEKITMHIFNMPLQMDFVYSRTNIMISYIISWLIYQLIRVKTIQLSTQNV